MDIFHCMRFPCGISAPDDGRHAARFIQKEICAFWMPSDSIIGAINRNAEIWNFVDEDDRQDIIQAVRTKTEKK